MYPRVYTQRSAQISGKRLELSINVDLRAKGSETMKAQHLQAITPNQQPKSTLITSLFGLVISILLVCLMLASTTTEAREKIYRWVDENGVTHYGEKPPKKEVEVDEMKTRRDYSSDAKAARQALDEKRKSRVQSDTAATKTKNEDIERLIEERKKKIEEGCQTAKKNLNVLSTHGRVKEAAEDGTPRYLSEEEHAERIRKTSQYLNDNCAPSQ